MRLYLFIFTFCITLFSQAEAGYFFYQEATAEYIARLEQEVFDGVNEYRKKLGKKPLQLDERISDQCRIHSTNMATGAVPPGHAGFNTERIPAIMQQISNTGRMGENCALNRGAWWSPALVAISSWSNSPGHAKNMQGPYDLTGVGAAQSENGTWYFTQIFVQVRL